MITRLISRIIEALSHMSFQRLAGLGLMILGFLCIMTLFGGCAPSPNPSPEATAKPPRPAQTEPYSVPTPNRPMAPTWGPSPSPVPTKNQTDCESIDANAQARLVWVGINNQINPNVEVKPGETVKLGEIITTGSSGYQFCKQPNSPEDRNGYVENWSGGVSKTITDVTYHAYDTATVGEKYVGEYVLMDLNSKAVVAKLTVTITIVAADQQPAP